MGITPTIGVLHLENFSSHLPWLFPPRVSVFASWKLTSETTNQIFQKFGKNFPLAFTLVNVYFMVAQKEEIQIFNEGRSKAKQSK
jgi:hypothetical protein